MRRVAEQARHLCAWLALAEAEGEPDRPERRPMVRLGPSAFSSWLQFAGLQGNRASCQERVNSGSKGLQRLHGALQ